MKTKKTISVHFGALCPPLWKQLGRRACELKPFQDDADAITRMYLRSVVTEAEKRAMRKRLIKAISQHLATIDDRTKAKKEPK